VQAHFVGFPRIPASRYLVICLQDIVDVDVLIRRAGIEAISDQDSAQDRSPGDVLQLHVQDWTDNRVIFDAQRSNDDKGRAPVTIDGRAVLARPARANAKQVRCQ
jgi:hypothetical protein